MRKSGRRHGVGNGLRFMRSGTECCPDGHKKPGNDLRIRITAVVLSLIVFLSFDFRVSAETVSDTWEPEAGNVLLAKLSEDLATAEILYDRNSDELIFPASTLKMLTALTVMDIADPEEKVWIGLEQLLVPSDASRAGISIPMRMTIRDLLKALLLPSGADAAYALASHCGRKLLKDKERSRINEVVDTVAAFIEKKVNDGTEDSATEEIECFVEAMNHKAASLGAENTTVINVDGYDAQGQMSSARDLLKISQAFLKEPVLAEICAMPEAVLDNGRGSQIPVRNTNEMLHEDSEYYNKDVKGIKTGTTSLAGFCLVSSFDILDEQYVCIVMNSSENGRYTDTQKLYEMCLAFSGGVRSSLTEPSTERNTG